jgi:hypothetical protein
MCFLVRFFLCAVGYVIRRLSLKTTRKSQHRSGVYTALSGFNGYQKIRGNTLFLTKQK